MSVTSSSPSRYHQHDRESRSPSWRTVIAVNINAGEKPIGDNISISIGNDCNPTPATATAVTAEVAARSLYARMKRSPPRMHTIAKVEKVKMYTEEIEKEIERNLVSLLYSHLRESAKRACNEIGKEIVFICWTKDSIREPFNLRFVYFSTNILLFVIWYCVRLN